MVPVPGFDPVSATRRLEALQSAVQAFPPERQPAVLRAYLEVQLDRLEALEDAHHAYLGECVLLAIDNMQDARLQAVEERLAKLESPDGPSLAEVLAEAAFVFALTLASLLAVEAVGGLVLLWAGKAATAPALRKVVEEADEAVVREARTQIAGLGADSARLTENATRLRGLTAALDGLRTGSVGTTLVQIGKALLNPIATARSITDAMSKALNIAAEMEQLQAKLLLGHLSLVEGMQTSTAARIAYDKALLGDATRPDAIWRNFMDNATGGLALAPAYSQLQGAWNQVKLATGPTTAPPAPPFLASTPAGRLLTLMRENRLAARQQYALLRAGLRYRTDDVFIEDPLVGKISELVNEMLPLQSAYGALEDSVRPLMVRGYEAALWWAYLSANGMLDVKQGVSFGTHYDPDIKVGSVVRGYVIKDFGESFTLTEASFQYYAADYYPGVPALSEDRAVYLFETFAGPYFALGDNAQSLPFAKWYAPERYAGVRAMHERTYAGFVEYTDRARRLDEMRLMVILFFARLPGIEDPTSSGLLNAMGELKGSPVSAQAWLELHPVAKGVLPPDLTAEGTASVAGSVAPALDALLRDSGVLKLPFYEAQRGRLQAAINELRADIAEMERLAAGELAPGATARGLDDEGYAAIVKAEKKALLDLYTEVYATAVGFDPEEATRLEIAYLPIVERLSAWTLQRKPLTVPGSNFHFDEPSDPP